MEEMQNETTIGDTNGHVDLAHAAVDGDYSRHTIEQIEAMTCADLRAVLKDLGEKTGGNKADLAERLRQRFGRQDPPPAGPDPAGGLDAERQRRLELEALNGTLARKQCRACATVGAWKIYNTERTHGRVRYIRCLACGNCDQAPIIVKEEDHGQEDANTNDCSAEETRSHQRGPAAAGGEDRPTDGR